MQVDPREVWDLMKVIGLGGKWGASDDDFVRYFEQLRQPQDQCDWDFVLDMVRDYMHTGGMIDETFAQVAGSRLDPVDWKRIIGQYAPVKNGTSRSGRCWSFALV